MKTQDGVEDPEGMMLELSAFFWLLRLLEVTKVRLVFVSKKKKNRKSTVPSTKLYKKSVSDEAVKW